MNKLILLCALLVLCGCTPKYDQLDFAVLPDGLKDCKFFYLFDGKGNNMKVARCPNSTTTVVSNGKYKAESLVVEESK